MGVVVESTTSAGEFLERAGAFLEAREAAHCLTLGFAGAVRDQPALAEATFRIAQAAGRIVATTLEFTDSGDVTLSEVDEPAAIGALAEAVATEVREVHAPSEHAQAFAEAIGSRIGRRVASPPHAADQRIFQLTSVDAPRGVAGALRRATPDDHAVLAEWLRAFEAEALGGDPGPQDEWLEALLKRPGRAAFLWAVDGRPVSMCTTGGRTPPASASAASIRHPSSVATATPARASLPRARSSSTRVDLAASSSPTSPTRPRTGSTRPSATAWSATSRGASFADSAARSAGTKERRSREGALDAPETRAVDERDAGSQTPPGLQSVALPAQPSHEEP